MSIGDKVRIREPFSKFFPGEYTITEVNETMTYVMLDGVESAFDFSYIEVI